MLRFNLLVIIILSVIYATYFLVTNISKRRSLLETVKNLVTFVYIMFVLKYTLFPIIGFDSLANELRNEIGFTRFNWIPLYSLYKDIKSASTYTVLRGILMQTILNICLSIPFGFLIKLFYNKATTIISKIWYALGFGLCIESLQLIISILIGYTYRVIDIDDIIFNAIGVFVGYFLYKIYSFVSDRLNTSLNQ